MRNHSTIRFSFSQCLRHAFFSGIGYGHLEKISDDDLKKWVEYDPPTIGCFASMEAGFQALAKPAELDEAAVREWIARGSYSIHKDESSPAWDDLAEDKRAKWISCVTMGVVLGGPMR